MRSIWSGAIGFGLVNIPVKLFSATKDSTLDLDMLDKRDHSNIKFKRINEHTGKEVLWENIVKGFKIDDKYVVLTDKDLEAANAEKSRLIEISSFVHEEEIDSMYFETPYYVVPDELSSRAYGLLREALGKTKKVGIASFVLRNKEILAILRPDDDVIILNRIRFAEEIKRKSDLDLPKRSAVKPEELKMAISLIDQLSKKFDISKFKDEYREQLMKLIRARAKGAKPTKPTLRVVRGTKTSDLMSQLKASLGKNKKAS